MVRVFLVDDHLVLRNGLRALLSGEPGLTVVGEAGNGRELLNQLPDTPADVVLLDINMPVMSGLETLQHLREDYPDVRVLMLSMLDNEQYVYQMLDAGAAGYILKSAGLDEIVAGIRTVASGRTFLSSEVGLNALQKLRLAQEHAPASKARPATLTKRELEVLGLIAAGLTNAEIADKLFTSRRTIETHRQNIIEKTQMKNTASLIRYALSEGLIS